MKATIELTEPQLAALGKLLTGAFDMARGSARDMLGLTDREFSTLEPIATKLKDSGEHVAHAQDQWGLR